MLNSFFDTVVKQANILVDLLDQKCDNGPIQMLPIMWTSTLNTIYETLGTVDPATLRKDNAGYIPMLTRYEELLIERATNLKYYFNVIWKMSSINKELIFLLDDMKTQIRETIERHLSSKTPPRGDFFKEKAFITRLQNSDYTSDKMAEEVAFMFVAGSETTANALCTLLLLMSIYPDIQEKLYEEQQSVLGDAKTPTIEDVNQLEFLDRVVKEAMRISPAIPCIGRYIDKTIKIDQQVYPEGAMVVIPIWSIHKNPEYWPDPFKFDPDRFLPEEVQKRPKCAYVPFSYGPRNCVGLKYGMMVVKVLFSRILREFEVKPGKYKSMKEIDMVFHFIAKPKEGYGIQMERRKCKV